MDSIAYRRAFVSADVNKDGRVDYKEFLVLCLDIDSLLHSDSIKQLFSMYDGGTGKITKEQLKKVIGQSQEG